MTAEQITVRPATERDAEAVAHMAQEFQGYLESLDDEASEPAAAKLTAEHSSETASARGHGFRC